MEMRVPSGSGILNKTWLNCVKKKCDATKKKKEGHI